MEMICALQKREVAAIVFLPFAPSSSSLFDSDNDDDDDEKKNI